MRMLGISLPSGPGMNIVKTRLPSAVYCTVERIRAVPPLPSGVSIVESITFFAESHVDSVAARPVVIESDHVPTYFFLAGSHVMTPWPSKGAPITVPLKSVARHRPPQLSVLVSTPVVGVDGAPGVSISIEASHVPRSSLRDRKSTRLNSSHGYISYAVFCLKKKKNRI